ncbi:MAG: hypothetical protein MJ241_02975 [Bacilli bacterium]|nr:hypothetical protein [Bacilli bacterium]
MHKNIGFKKEDEFVEALDGKKAGELSHNLKHILREMFGFFKETDKVRCELVPNYQKPDFFIEMNGVRKYVSLKHGKAKTVGQDKIKPFILYLRECGLSKEGQKTILLLQFGDGTLDGSGDKRLPYDELVLKYKKRIEELNEELNEDKDFIKAFVERYVFKGTVSTNIEADYIYHGDVNYGVIVSKAQLFKHLERRSYAYMINPHVGPLQFKPHARYSGEKEILNEHQRWKVDINWANLASDMDYISERYDG